LATDAFPQKAEREGKAWVAEQTAPAQVNVNGSWHHQSWGQLVLVRHEGSRDITGTGSGYDLFRGTPTA
jgi:hypothetical protein